MDAKKEILAANSYNRVRELAIEMSHAMLSDLYSEEYADAIVKMVGVIDRGRDSEGKEDFDATSGIAECIQEAFIALGNIRVNWLRPIPFVKFNQRVFDDIQMCEELMGPVEEQSIVHVHALQVQEFRYFISEICDNVLTKVDPDYSVKITLNNS